MGLIGAKITRIVAIHGAKFGEGQEETLDVVLLAIVHQVEILRVDGYALKNGSNAAHDDITHLVSVQDLN
jgi:hypothetical protein